MTEWIIKNNNCDAREIEVRGKKIPRLIVQLLKNRGFDTPEKIEKFFAPGPEDLHDPFLLPEMDRAVERIDFARRNNEKILLHGDYDTDGISSVALLARNLPKLGLATESFLPNRFTEGYGLSKQGVDCAALHGCSLIVAADCGTTAAHEIAYAAEKNIDTIVCDHHQPGSPLPRACALVNPRLDRSAYPFKDLAGVGVAFKFLQAAFQRLGLPADDLYQDLDLIALGTVVDVAPLCGENRYLVKQGLKVINRRARPGLAALIDDNRLNAGVAAYHLGFVLGPRLNACGRLRDAREALELLLTDDQPRARELAQILDRDNRERQQIQETIYREARAMIASRGLAAGRVIVIGSEQWHEGVIGIVAARIAEEYCRPAILLAIKGDHARGSCRSVRDFDIAAALAHCAGLLTRFGGHRQAAGLELDAGRIAEFSGRINEYAAGFRDDIFVKKRYYDAAVELTDLTADVTFFLKYFEPTGTENPAPVFKTEHCEVVGVPRVVGGDHLKFALRKHDRVIDAVAYGQADNILAIIPGRTRVDCLYTVSENSFLDKRKLVLKVKDLTIDRVQS